MSQTSCSHRRRPNFPRLRISAESYGLKYCCDSAIFSPLLKTAGMVLVCCVGWQHARAATLEWTRNFRATATPVLGKAVWADGLGSAYVAGGVAGAFAGQQAAGRGDYFLTKFDDTGNLQWTRQFGTSDEDYVAGVAADRLGNNIYVAGRHEVSFTRNNQVDLTKFDAQGTLLWTMQLPPAHRVETTGVAVDDAGSVYVSGYANTEVPVQTPSGYEYNPAYAFITKYDALGNLEWMKQFSASASDYTFAKGVSVDASGGVYVSGDTGGNLGGPNAGGYDAFLQKYDAAGNVQWTKQLGTALHDREVNVSADGVGNVFIAGQSGPNASGGGLDTFLAKYNSAGDLLWTKQIGISDAVDGWNSWDSSISADGQGNVYLSSYFSRFEPGNVRNDAYLAKFDGTGSMLWMDQFRPTQVSEGMSADRRGHVYMTGWGAFLTKYTDPVPEPSSLVLLGLMAIALAPITRGSRRRKSIHDSD